MITVAETKAFQRQVRELLSVREKENLINYLAEHPGAGALLQGTGGIRKLRCAQIRPNPSHQARKHKWPSHEFMGQQWVRPLFPSAIWQRLNNDEQNL